MDEMRAGVLETDEMRAGLLEMDEPNVLRGSLLRKGTSGSEEFVECEMGPCFGRR